MRACLALGLSLLASSAVFACGGGSHGSAPGDAGGDVTHPVEAGADAGTDAAGDAAASHPNGGTDMGGDAEADADNGAPSTNYPAPHPPLPTLMNADKGPVLTTPHVYLVFYPSYPSQNDITTFAQKMMQSTYWSTTTSEYGVGAFTYSGTIVLTGQTAPTTISSTDIETWIGSEIQSGAFGTPDPEAVYTVVYPSSTTITQPNPVSTLLPASQSCVAFGGYHDNVNVPGADGGAGQNYAYAIIPTCGGTDALTEAISHEWIEASTDPFLTSSGAFMLMGGPDSAYFTVDTGHAIWALLGGGEAGDLCEPEQQDVYVTPNDLGYAVQRTWSNMQAAGSHDPCVPEIQGAFFDSAPVLDEMVTFNSSLTGSITTQGVTIPVGSSRTIEVDLFSDGDTNGPWTVSAADVLSNLYGSYGITPSMTFAWDRTQGVNGEKLHLTITVTSASVIGNGHAFMITSSTQAGRVSVWPGMVVE